MRPKKIYKLWFPAQCPGENSFLYKPATNINNFFLPLFCRKIIHCVVIIVEAKTSIQFGSVRYLSPYQIKYKPISTHTFLNGSYSCKSIPLINDRWHYLIYIFLQNEIFVPAWVRFVFVTWCAENKSKFFLPKHPTNCTLVFLIVGGI